uniref:ARAD1B15620p n=1 Tax=Blastobotrys adeninivorans TaxID=409370 RepID=A0A060TBG5_BLAAD
MSLTYDDISFYFKYDNNPVELQRWLRKVLPVAKWGSLTHDVVIDIENGFVVDYKIGAIMQEYGVRGRVTAGLLGYYSIVLHSAPHVAGTKFIRYLYIRIAALLGVQDPGSALCLLDFLVTETGTGRRIFQDEVARMLVPMVEEYFGDHFGDHLGSRIPIASAESTASKVYTKEPDQSFQPDYHVGADNSTDLPTAICEVTMGGQVSRLIFNCLSSLAGSRGKIDLSLGVDLTINNQGLTRIRLFVLDSSITTLVRFSENASVARFTRSKIENRLIHLHHLQDRLQAMQTREERVKYRDYVHIQPTIVPTIEYYERMQDYLIATSGGEVANEDIVETCRVVLENAEIVQMTRGDDGFIVTDINGEPLNGLAVKVEAFLGLIMGFEAQVELRAETLHDIYSAVSRAFKGDRLESTPSPIPGGTSQITDMMNLLQAKARTSTAKHSRGTSQSRPQRSFLAT